jgi:hypothetical protein
MKSAKLTLVGKNFDFPTVVGTEDEVGVDFLKLRPTTAAMQEVRRPSMGLTVLAQVEKAYSNWSSQTFTRRERHET